MNEIKIISRAKLNWLLQVGPPRPDGYHDIVTVFQELNIGDSMVFTVISEDDCRLSGFPNDIDPSTNLVSKAWNLMRARYPAKVGGLHVSIEKKLPRGGGLGGGSSNAAATINAINDLFGLNLRDAELQELGSELGSDVAFFIRGGTAIATGRGEKLIHVPTPPSYHLVLLFPKESMSTSDGYRLLDEISRPIPSQHTVFDFLTILNSGDPQAVGLAINNDFELVAERFEWFNAAKFKLDNAGVIKAFLCGSGSTVAGLCKNSDTAQQIALQLGGCPSYTWPMHI